MPHQAMAAIEANRGRPPFASLIEGRLAPESRARGG